MSITSATRTSPAKQTRSTQKARPARPNRQASRAAKPAGQVRDSSAVSGDARKADVKKSPVNFDSWKTMSKGSASNAGNVKELQTMLNKELGLSLKDDGKFGSKTLDAVKQFQEKNNLKKVDGIVGPETRAALQSGSGQPGAAQPGAQVGQPGGAQVGQPGAAQPGGQAGQPGAAPAGQPNSTQVDPKFKEKLPKPLQHLADKFQQAGQKYNVDPKFLAAISMMETGKGTSSAFRNKNNAMGVSNARGPISFNDPAESIEKMAKGLSNPKGYYRNASTINQIGRIYAPPGAGNDPNGTNGHWPAGVTKFYRELGGDPSKPVIFR